MKKLECGYPMGRFTLGDFVGLDTTFYTARIMFDIPGEALRSAAVVEAMVTAGLYGRKSVRGFYDYSDSNNPKPMNLL